MKIIVLMCLIMISNIAEGITKNDFLITPTGRYAIGYKDIFVINDKICPDEFYIKNINESDFSSNNTKHCHEINIRVYYPSAGKPKLGDNYYSPILLNNIAFYAKKLNLSESTISFMKSALKIKTYTIKNAPIYTKSKFPVIVFIPGYGIPVQSYNNIISELVSNGYVVIGCNSMFVNNAIQLKNGHIISSPNKYHDFGRLENLEDLKFILAHLKYLKYGNKLYKQMEFNNIGLLGHSMGGMSIVNMFKQGYYESGIKDIILMDPGNILESANYPIMPIAKPSMIIWSSNFKYLLHGKMVLGKNDFEILLAGSVKDIDYSNHENFSDLSTLQYNSAYKIDAVYSLITDPQHLGVGLGNGYDISSAINDYIINFFDLHLKKRYSELLQSCHAKIKKTLLFCNNKN